MDVTNAVEEDLRVLGRVWPHKRGQGTRGLPAGWVRHLRDVGSSLKTALTQRLGYRGGGWSLRVVEDAFGHVWSGEGSWGGVEYEEGGEGSTQRRKPKNQGRAAGTRVEVSHQRDVGGIA